jgi:hypothetical protein
MLGAMPQERPPHTTVEVRFDNADYVNACARWGGGEALLDKWRELGDRLAHRTGWHFDIVNYGEALWSLGAYGESRLNITVHDDGYHCFDYDEDTTRIVQSVAAVESWLEDREEKSREFSPVLRHYMSNSDWALMRTYEQDVHVTWSDGWFSATVRGLRIEPCLAATLAEVVRNAQQMIVRAADAPDDLAADIPVRLHVDPNSVRRFITPVG